MVCDGTNRIGGYDRWYWPFRPSTRSHSISMLESDRQNELVDFGVVKVSDEIGPEIQSLGLQACMATAIQSRTSEART